MLVRMWHSIKDYVKVRHSESLQFKTSIAFLKETALSSEK